MKSLVKKSSSLFMVSGRLSMFACDRPHLEKSSNVSYIRFGQCLALAENHPRAKTELNNLVTVMKHLFPNDG